MVPAIPAPAMNITATQINRLLLSPVWGAVAVRFIRCAFLRFEGSASPVGAKTVCSLCDNFRQTCVLKVSIALRAVPVFDIARFGCGRCFCPNMRLAMAGGRNNPIFVKGHNLVFPFCIRKVFSYSFYRCNTLLCHLWYRLPLPFLLTLYYGGGSPHKADCKHRKLPVQYNLAAPPV